MKEEYHFGQCLVGLLFGEITEKIGLIPKNKRETEKGMCFPLALHFHHQPLIFDRLSSILYMWQLHQLKLKNYIPACFQVYSKIPFVRVYVHMGNEMARLELVWT